MQPYLIKSWRLRFEAILTCQNFIANFLAILSSNTISLSASHASFSHFFVKKKVPLLHIKNWN